VGNAPKEFDKKVKGTGILLGAPSALNSSLPVLATQLAGADKRADTRKGTDVDLILGTAFKDLTPKAAADKALAALANPQPTSTSTRKAC